MPPSYHLHHNHRKEKKKKKKTLEAERKQFLFGHVTCKSTLHWLELDQVTKLCCAALCSVASVMSDSL